jgi:hypothetical protein
MREFKIDITLAAEVAQFLEGILEAEFNEELDAEAPVTDTYLDQFMPNGFVPNAELIEALLASGIITAQKCKHDVTKTIRTVSDRKFQVCCGCNKVVSIKKVV